jgi:hypothetical protein
METFIQETLDRQGNVHQEVLARSPLHDALLSIGYVHQWTTHVGPALSHAYRHPDDLTLKFDEIKNNLDSILPDYTYWTNQNAQGVDIHNYHKGEAGDAVTTDPNNPQGGHYLSHYYDSTMEHA